MPFWSKVVLIFFFFNSTQKHESCWPVVHKLLFSPIVWNETFSLRLRWMMIFKWHYHLGKVYFLACCSWSSTMLNRTMAFSQWLLFMGKLASPSHNMLFDVPSLHFIEYLISSMDFLDLTLKVLRWLVACTHIICILKLCFGFGSLIWSLKFDIIFFNYQMIWNSSFRIFVFPVSWYLMLCYSKWNQNWVWFYRHQISELD